MNTSVLTKCLEELKQEKPNIEYIKGMLETFIALSNTSLPVTGTISYANTTTSQIHPVVRTESVSDEEMMLQKYEKGQTGRITN